MTFKYPVEILFNKLKSITLTSKLLVKNIFFGLISPI
jgi:hypothetical protein